MRKIIVLDLARVGTGAGVSTVALCRRIASEHPEIEVVTGGGVSQRQELAVMAATGIHALLIGTALHDGRITCEDIDRVERGSNI